MTWVITNSDHSPTKKKKNMLFLSVKPSGLRTKPVFWSVQSKSHCSFTRAITMFDTITADLQPVWKKKSSLNKTFARNAQKMAVQERLTFWSMMSPVLQFTYYYGKRGLGIIEYTWKWDVVKAKNLLKSLIGIYFQNLDWTSSRFSLLKICGSVSWF